ncbi:hydroxymethylglutaryl-CoA lyase [Nakamurella sp. YIM 132084]|uniref:Hydroxymethylglutaryl-CoA lyase n=1 Tax=Nakamurella leprariae TaxID=2803911 RepID=A0A939BZR9_9ACTN|nr:hydroxymethylglutaryl-CoA lyase [Nakamurella leprariae]
MPTAVDIREVGPRDGLQIEAPISTAAKRQLLQALARTGVRRIEATAFVSPTAVPAMADAAAVAEVVQEIDAGRAAGSPPISWSALVPNLAGARRALAAGFTELEYVVSAADGHSLANVRRPTADALAAVAEVAAAAHEAGGRCEVIVATAWDCPFDGRTPVVRTAELCARAVELGADRLCLGDTIGTATPGRVIDLLDAVRAAVPAVDVGAHFHNTRGAGLACAWAAVTAGVTSLDASTGGLGGCPFAPGASGNIATEELALLLGDSGVDTGIDLDAALAAAGLAEELVGHPGSSNLLRAGGRSRPRGRPRS